jgi:cell division protein FtsL
MLNNAITHSVEVIIVRYTVLAYQPALHIAVAHGSREMVVRSALLKTISTCTEVVLYFCTLICGISLKIMSLYLKKQSVSTT